MLDNFDSLVYQVSTRGPPTGCTMQMIEIEYHLLYVTVGDFLAIRPSFKQGKYTYMYGNYLDLCQKGY